MAIDFGRAARGIATGYLTAKVADTAAQDDLNRQYILQATDQYFNVDKPTFVADEKKRSANIDFIATKLSPVYANYADANNITLSDVNTRDFISSINDLSNQDKFKLESTIVERKKTRTQTFDEKNKFITDQFANLKGGPGAMNITNMFFPNEGKDISEVGINQTEAPVSTAPIQSIMEIEGTGSGVYDFNNTSHRQLERIGATQFNQLFFDRNTQRFNFTISGDKGKDGDFVDSRYPTVQLLKKGYADAIKEGYEFGFEVYARDKFIQLIMDSRGIKGYTGTLPSEVAATEATTTESTIQDNKAVPDDGKKFDPPDTSQIGAKEDVNINLKSKRAVEGGGFGSAATVINDLRDIIARISDSPSLSDDEKSNRIDTARARAKERLEAMGLDSDNFNL